MVTRGTNTNWPTGVAMHRLTSVIPVFGRVAVYGCSSTPPKLAVRMRPQAGYPKRTYFSSLNRRKGISEDDHSNRSSVRRESA